MATTPTKTNVTTTAPAVTNKYVDVRDDVRVRWLRRLGAFEAGATTATSTGCDSTGGSLETAATRFSIVKTDPQLEQRLRFPAYRSGTEARWPQDGQLAEIDTRISVDGTVLIFTSAAARTDNDTAA